MEVCYHFFKLFVHHFLNVMDGLRLRNAVLDFLRYSRLEAEALIIERANDTWRLCLCIIGCSQVDRMSRVFKGGLSRSWLNLPVVELTLRIDVQPSSSLIVLVALDVASLALPFIA